jgi:hypothetical protein
MADHYISWNKGDGISPGNITTGTSSTGTDQVELRMLDGAALTQVQVLLAIEAFEAYITTHSVTA